MRKIASLAFALFAVSGMTFGEELSDGREAALTLFWGAFTKASSEGDKEAWMSFYLPDAIMILPHEQPILGREQIGQFLDEYRPNVVVTPDDPHTPRRLDLIGDTAIYSVSTTGHYFLKKTGEKIPFDSMFLDVLRFVEGKWYVAYHVASANTAELGLWDGDWKSHLDSGISLQEGKGAR